MGLKKICENKFYFLKTKYIIYNFINNIFIQNIKKSIFFVYNCIYYSVSLSQPLHIILCILWCSYIFSNKFFSEENSFVPLAFVELQHDSELVQYLLQSKYNLIDKSKSGSRQPKLMSEKSRTG
ncbi:hypothetical protein EDEG_03530 [Edhazardia aedis USNM 41457]|uniref:Uncharacterized protein n=1 Tax=Edhazardia aedis (strain USNM 41457) TaxID=1003232 RepID=J9DHD9_EDHAE|nr:hypothetical protein EDEG_03530 [Edhazardia aedis USNM 41457]|eukprot:EJW02020.1 hypothetical protein EDEG_03530 [Edhazardia aedis USNM 41457]